MIKIKFNPRFFWLPLILLANCTQVSAAPALLPWANLEVGDQLRLEKNLSISPSLKLTQSMRWDVIDTLTLDPVPAMVFTLRASHCVGLSPVPVPLIILKDGSGFEWNGACLSKWYVEFKDLSHNSYFTSESN